MLQLGLQLWLGVWLELWRQWRTHCLLPLPASLSARALNDAPTPVSLCARACNTSAPPQTIRVAIVDDQDAEGPETFQVVLSSPANATLGAASTATITIRKSDVSLGRGTPRRRWGACIRRWWQQGARVVIPQACVALAQKRGGPNAFAFGRCTDDCRETHHTAMQPALPMFLQIANRVAPTPAPSSIPRPSRPSRLWALLLDQRESA